MPAASGRRQIPRRAESHSGDSDSGVTAKGTGQFGLVAVADTWNRRVQLFTSEGVVLREWQIPSWDVSHPDEKPFLSWYDGSLYVTDPMRGRVLAFDEEGQFQWALSGPADERLAFPVDLLVDDDVLYVTDAHRGALVSYGLP